MNSISKKLLLCLLFVVVMAALQNILLHKLTTSAGQQLSAYLDNAFSEMNALQSVQHTSDSIKADAYAFYATAISNQQFESRIEHAGQYFKQALGSGGVLSAYAGRQAAYTQSIQLLTSIRQLQTTMIDQPVDWNQVPINLLSIEAQSANLSKKLETLKSALSNNMTNASASIHTALNAISRFAMVLLLIIMIVAVTMYVMTRKTIVQPLKKMVKELDYITDNHDLTCQLSDITNNDMSDATKSINRCIAELNNSLKLVVNAAADIGSFLSHLDQSSQQPGHHVAILNDKFEQLLFNMNSVQHLTEQSLDGSRTALDIAQRGADEVHQGASDVADTSEGVAALAKDIEASSMMLMELKTSGSEVSTVVSTIAEIAEQTNLLALNAAIEAARAGESGRGFAVVADEVRTLANRTHQSTIEINTMLEKIVGSISDVVAAMQVNESKASEAVELASKTVLSLSQIQSTVLALSQENQQVTELAGESHNQVAGILQSVEAFKNLVEAVNSDSHASTDNSSKTSLQMHRLSESLARFKL